MSATSDPIEPAAGELWAYRHHRDDRPVAVSVVRLGTKRPTRVLVRFLDDDFEGLQEWVPPTRLKVPWKDVDTFLAREAQWEDVRSAEPGDVYSDEDGAAGTVFYLLIDDSLARAWNYGITKIADPVGLAAFLGLDPAVLSADPLSFLDDGVLVVPWPTSKLIAMRAAERDPRAVLTYVQREEADAQREAAAGRWYRGRAGQDGHHISAEICAKVDAEHGAPVRAILRAWCGVETVNAWDEVAALRSETDRLAQLVEKAAQTLRQRGFDRDAKRLEAALQGAE